LTDFTILAANFNGTSKTFSQGDFNYDTNVDLTDFTILASKFNQTLAPAVVAATRAAPAAPTLTAASMPLGGTLIDGVLADVTVKPE
jgi:hypothetical protein